MDEDESHNFFEETEVKLEKLDFHLASTSEEQSNFSHGNNENTEQTLLPTVVVKMENSENSQFYDEENSKSNDENPLRRELPRIQITKINENNLLAKENAWLRTENLKLFNELLNQRQLKSKAESEAIRLNRVNEKLIDKIQNLFGNEILKGFLTEHKVDLHISKENIKKSFLDKVLISDKNKLQQQHEYLLKKAIEDVMTKRKGLREAAKIHKVPRSTLSAKLLKLKSGEEVNLKIHVGGGTYPTFDETLEQRLVEHISQLATPLTKWEFKKLAFDLAEGLNINHSFNKNRRSAGENFYRGFKLRHPDVVFRFRPKVA